MPTATLSYRLAKAERIHLRRHIQELFTSRQAFVSYPLRVVYLVSDQPLDARAQILVSVSKRYFRRAHDRNRIKRLIRESYRLNKHPWLERLAERGLYVQVALMYISRDLPPYESVERATTKALGRILRELSPTTPPTP